MSEMNSRYLVLEFTKMSGAGNDFIVVDTRFYHFDEKEYPALARRLCPRRTAIGADGLLALGRSTRTDTDFRMIYYNADGSRGTMCGNGARCLARFARLAGLGNVPLVFEADAGIYSALVPENVSEPVRLFVPGFRDFKSVVEISVDTPDSITSVASIWTGTEHAVIHVPDIDSVPVLEIGAKIRSDAVFSPTGTNVNFVEIRGSGTEAIPHLAVRTFEKGVENETLACGTGAIASALASLLQGRINGNHVSVQMRGGTLAVGFEGSVSDPRNLYLEGAAAVVYRGTVEIPV